MCLLCWQASCCLSRSSQRDPRHTGLIYRKEKDKHWKCVSWYACAYVCRKIKKNVWSDTQNRNTHRGINKHPTDRRLSSYIRAAHWQVDLSTGWLLPPSAAADSLSEKRNSYLVPRCEKLIYLPLCILSLWPPPTSFRQFYLGPSGFDVG